MTVQKTLSLTVNRQSYVLPIIPGEKLSDLLRKRLRLTGTKIGCGEAKCSTCTVLVDGKPIKSCVYPSERTQGKTILTIEGLAEIVDETLKLHPLQEAFITHGAIQCGFCTPGQIMASYALLQEKPNPTNTEIRHALRNNLCRCGAYPSIESAIQAAAQSMQTSEKVQPLSVPSSSVKNKIIGQTILRPDAIEKATGSARYSDDLSFDGMLFASVKRTDVPHAILRKLDVSEAKSIPGVVAVLTAMDIPGEQNHGLVISDWPSMIAIDEEIHYIGDALAIIAAESQEIANKAMDLIETEYEVLPVVTDPIQSFQLNAPVMHKGGNLLKHIKVRKGVVDQGFSEADIILEHTFNTPTMDHAFMEPECSIAVPTSDGRMEVYVGSQIPYADREQVARALNWPEERVRVLGQLMGGGFGGKEDITGQIHAALLANATQQPVKLLFDRHESFLVHPKRPATQIRIKSGAKSDGHILAVETELYGDTGAYASLGQKVMTRATTHSAGPYDIPHTKADCYAMYTNNPPSGAYRGFGVIQSAFAVES
ncbi:MAG: molybdopterin-dependent oxidoreductase, partial [Anaerolineaceae bacterium]|nr:molybdopterin-dependent oxidoreductase [Anaerolineaceae bacterium]